MKQRGSNVNGSDPFEMSSLTCTPLIVAKNKKKATEDGCTVVNNDHFAMSMKKRGVVESENSMITSRVRV